MPWKRYLYVFKTEVSKIRRNQKEGVKREMWSIKLRYRKQWSSFEIIILGFAGVILAGALLLMLPVASREGNVTPFTETLFTATSAACVTGLAVRDTGSYWSVFGQSVILLLIQIGGLGVVTIAVSIAMLSGRKISLMQRSTMQDAISAPKVGGIVRLTRFILKGTFGIELLGALFLLPVFLRDYGGKGIWMALFHSVSAFCNAGFDLLGKTDHLYPSLTSYVENPLVNLTIMGLIVIGGIGFLTWDDIYTKKYHFRQYCMQSKVILLTSLFLIFVPAAFFFFRDFAGMPVKERTLCALFQSVTTRTAGFDALIQNNLTDLSKAWGTVLMMIGGASGSTAGGVKLGTAVLVIMTLISVLRGKSDVVIHGRRVAHTTILHAMALLVLWLMLVVGGSVLISYIDNQDLINSIYEAASAYSTVGLSVGVSGSASTFTKILLIVYMFFGRVGIMTISVVFMTRIRKTNDIRYPECSFIVG